MAVTMNTQNREKQPHDVSGGVREHRTMRRSGPVTGANMVGRRESRIATFYIEFWTVTLAYPPA
jgi:hypothetical protein